MQGVGEVVQATDGVVELRPWTTSDAGFLLEACCDEAIRRFWLRQPLETLDDAAAMSDALSASWVDFHETGAMKRLAFLIAEAPSGTPLGLCGVDEWFADGSVQIGYFLAPGARGRGYATRAVRLLMSWLFELGARKVFATTDPLNADSIAVLRRAGFVDEKKIRGSEMDETDAHGVAMFTHAPPRARPQP